MRLVILYTRLSGYIAACLREVKQLADAEILIFAYPPEVNAPFSSEAFSSLGQIINRADASDKEIRSKIQKFAPDAIIVSGWRDQGYLSICRYFKEKNVLVISGCDTQWKGSLRQRIAGILSPFYLHRSYHVMWITGERQRQLASKLGYRGRSCWDGFYSCDFPAFERLSIGRDNCSGSTGKRAEIDKAESFLYVGRYAPVKGLDTLAAAYREYWQRVDKPWKLICAGQGPLRDSLVKAGGEDLGFIQPKDLPALFASVSAFVLPSRFEPWGVVLHEASTAGLPLIVSEAVGAGVHLLRDGWNGLLTQTGNVENLTAAMLEFHHASPSRLAELGRNSYLLSKQYTPTRWARQLINGLAYWQDNNAKPILFPGESS